MTAPAAPAGHSTTRAWDRLRLGLAVVWLAVTVAVVALHDSPSSFTDLVDDVRAGRVERVVLEGFPVPGGATGSSTTTARWTRGWRHLTATVERTSETGSGALGTDGLAAELRQLDPQLQVTQVVPGSGWSAQVAGTRLPGVAVPVVLLALVATLLLLTQGPQPWRATRWGWAWLLAVPGGAAAFCLLSGPTSGLPAPRSGRRLTGGWSFLLAAALGSLGNAVGGSA